MRLVEERDSLSRFVGHRQTIIADHVTREARGAAKTDFRANLTAGGDARKPKITERMLELASIVGPRLRHDGIFFAGLDIVGDRIVEINTISTGALNSAQRIQGVDFASAIVELVERKVAAKAQYGSALPNRVLATLS